MRFQKQAVYDLPYCYAVGSMRVGGRLTLLFASDGPGPCYAIDPVAGTRETVWDGPGGTMCFVPIGDGGFLAVQRFFPDYEAAESRIVRARRDSEGWHVETFLELPYLHRFDILEREGRRYLICCTLCTKKEYKEDWRSPGRVLTGELDKEKNLLSGLVPVAEGMTKNHGYWRVQREGNSYALTSSEAGVFEVFPPEQTGGTWTVRNILPNPVSDIALCDIDGDGVDEMAVIEPFHGNMFVIYRRHQGKYVRIYEYPHDAEFCHAIWGGRLRGEPAFIGGFRGGDRELFLLRWRDAGITREVIEAGRGPSNVLVTPGYERDILAVANRESGEGAVFLVTDL